MRTVERWSTGMYSLIKRSTDEKAAARAQVLVVGVEFEARKRYEGWLEEHGFATNVVTHHKQALQVASFLNPDVVIMACPKLGQKMTCEQFREQMAKIMGAPPLVVTIAEGEQRCEDPNILCQVKPLSLEQMSKLLSKRWPNTLYGQRQDLERQLTKRISSEHPMLFPPPQGEPADPDIEGGDDDEIDTNPQAFPRPEETTDEIETPEPETAEPPEEVTEPSLEDILALPSVDIAEDYPSDESTDETTNVVTRVINPTMIVIAVAVLALGSGLIWLIYLLN